MEIIEYNLQILSDCKKVLVPTWHTVQTWNHPGVSLEIHSYDFAEYRDSSDQVLLRHTLSAT